MLSSEQVSKLHKLNREIDNLTYDLKQQRQDEHDRLQKVVIQKTVEKVLEAIGKSHFEAVITFAIRDAMYLEKFGIEL